MKFYFYIILSFILCASATHGQNNTSGKEVFTIVEEAAEFPGGMTGMANFIQKNLIYPENSLKCALGGKVFLKFIVNEDGNISDCEVLKGSLVPELDRAAVECVKSMPNWKPARMTGRPVKCYFNLPVNFKLNGDQPYIVFASNSNEHYVQAKDALALNGDIDLAISHLQKDVGDPDAWFVMGVLYYYKNEKSKAQKYFENVKLNAVSGSKAQELSGQFLAKYF